MTDSRQRYDREHAQNVAFFKDAVEVYRNDLIVIMDARHCFRPMHRPWRGRALSDVRGLVVHHRGAWNSFEDMQKNVVLPRYNADPSGKHDRIAYTFGVDHDPEVIDGRVVIWQFNDLDAVTWASGSPGKDSSRFTDWRRQQGPGRSANSHTVSINLSGYFSSTGHEPNHPEAPTPQAMSKGRGGRLICQPSIAQCQAVFGLWEYLEVEHDADGLFGHIDTGKHACPGDTAQELVEAIGSGEVTAYMDLVQWIGARPIYSGYPTAEQVLGYRPTRFPPGAYQYLLVQLGYDIGRTGPKGDGIDGKWGAKSRLALIDFEERNSLLANGEPDSDDYDALLSAVEDGVCR